MKKRSVSKAAAVLLAVLLLCSVGTTAFAADALGAGSAVAAGAAGDAPAEEGAALPTPDSEPEASGSTDESEASPSAEPSVMPSAAPETETGEDDAAPTPSAAPENGGLTASPDTLAAPIADEGFTWDAETKTLTITAADISAIQTELAAHKTDAQKLVIDTTGDIPEKAFNGFTAVEEIQIDNAGSIGKQAFYNCGNNTKLIRNIKIKKAGDIAAEAFYRLNGAGGTLTVTECGNIATDAFRNAKLSGSASIQKCGDIAANAFRSANVNGNGVTALEIGICGSIGEDAFAGLSSLETAKIDSITGEIKDLFSSLKKLTSVEIGSCEDIPQNAFAYCEALKVITISKCANIGSNAFRSCKSVEELSIVECADISSNAFLGMTALRSVKIDTCGKIGSSAFSSMMSSTGAEPCKALEDVVIGQCTEIGEFAFYQLKNLKNISIGACQSVGRMAFTGVGNSENPIETLALDGVNLGENVFGSAHINNLVLKNMDSVGSQAFVSATIRNITISNISEIGSEAFAYLKGLETLTIEDLEEISDTSFRIEDEGVCAVETITLRNIRRIGAYAFENFKNLKEVVIEGGCEYIGAHAFSGCSSLESIDIADETRLGYSDSFVNQQYVHDRVAAILAGSFALIDTTPAIDEILPEGWTSVKTGGQNSTASVGDTQLTKEAKWADAEATVADVLIKAYYSVNQQMDFVFVADCSNSMSGFGSADAMNSNFYNMQSKLMDVTETLLNAEDLDTRVAFTTFGEDESSVSKFFQKGQTAEAESYIWNDIVNYYSNTNYSHGLAEALELVKENKAAGRNTTVIFISDGQPYYDGTTVPEEYYGAAEADAIRAEGVQIISVLQQVPESELASSQANMEKIADKVFSSTDLDGFSTAMNGAIDYAYTTYTLTDTVDPAFALDADSIEASAGDVVVSEDENGNTVLTWTITNAPFEEHTLSFKENLKPDDKGIRPTGSLDTNEGDAVLYAGSTPVNAVKTPVLPRGTSMTVEKVWKNDTADVRPDSVEVTLLRAGEAFETVELTEQGGWKYTWPALDPAYTWSVGETSVPEGYQSAVSGSGAAWTITNTYTVVATLTPAPTATPAPTPEVTPAPTATPAPEATPTAAPEVTPSPAPEKPAVDTPKTGDDTNPFIWFSVMLAAAGSMTAVLAVRRRGKRARHGR